MVDFIIAGIIYLSVMFIVFFCLSFVTIGLTYSAAAFVKRCQQWRRQPDFALK